MTADRGTLEAHYRAIWPGTVQQVRLDRGPIGELSSEFGIVVLPTTDGVRAYATVGMSEPGDDARLELHLLCRDGGIVQDEVVEVMTAVAHYHRTGARLGHGHTVNFGRPWIAGASCSSGLISLPYLDGPALEWLETPRVQFLWLIPITEAEVAFKKRNGLEALEATFETTGFDYLDPRRPSVV